MLYHDTPHAANLGAPLPGTTVKLVPWADSFELRVRGPNVMPGYWRDSEATDAVFDDEGFYLMGDAGKLAQPNAPEQGIVFDDRVSENFKLSTGTWVNVGALRLALITALDPLVSDAVIAGEGRDEAAVLLFCNQAACIAMLGDLTPSQLEAAVAERLQSYNDSQLGSSSRVSRFAIPAEPPSAADGEITDKGYLNQRAVLRRRHAIVERLYASPAAQEFAAGEKVA
ncbi:AMP-binding protein [Sphingomonas sp. RB3P16]|uniref:hypothetical protein n=1 Tax=Parasphingomonas frigoris TaxID=3096163 RepID=UPI002FCB6801